MQNTTVKTFLAFLIAGIAVSSTANAETKIRLRVGAGLGQYSVTSDLPAGGGHVVDYKADYTATPVGLTMIFDNDLYVDLLTQSASGTAKFDWSPEKPSYKRDDITLTIGTRKGNASFYAGYKTGQAISNWPTGYAPDKLSASGFLAGFGWAIPFSSSAFNVGAGVGVMTGTYTYAASTTPLSSDTTIGFSVSAGYTYVFNPSWSLNGDLKWQSYKYQFSSSSIKENPAQMAVNLLFTF